jgi:sugar/nucleoside kinase (ribokinase family)
VAVAADTTGAGDAFNAGLVTALNASGNWAAAIDAATRFATEIVSRPSHDRWRPALLDRAAD